MLKKECEKCKHMNRNQCEFDKERPVNMEIGSIGGLSVDDDSCKPCKDFKKRDCSKD